MTGTDGGSERIPAQTEPDGGVTRRTALQRVGVGALGLTSFGSLLAACGGSSSASSGSGGGSSSSSGGASKSSGPEVPIASRDRPLALPTSSDNKAIASGLKPEKGPLIIYDWADYLSPAVVTSFEQRYGVQAKVTTFASTDEAVNKIASGAVQADVWVPDAERMLALVQAKLIQPINHSYIPNLGDVIPAAADPFYDKGARYSTPNFINLFGTAWRNDLLKIDPAALSNPWDVFWKVPAGTPMGMLNGAAYDSLSMALLRNGLKNLDRITQKDISDAVSSLQELKGLKLQYTAFQPLATGVEKLAYAYNGDMVQIPHFLPQGTPVTNVSFFFPKDGYGIILNDMWVIPRKAKNPVLAHMFMNHFLELESAISNFRDEGYQTMLKDLTADRLKAAKVADPYVIDMSFATPAHQENGIPVPILTTDQLKWYEAGFAQLSKG